MALPTTFRARDAQGAARSGVLIVALFSVLLLGVSVVGPEAVDAEARTASRVGAGLLAIVGATLWLSRPALLDRCGVFVGFGLAGVLLTCVLNTVTRDPSAAGQAFLAFPVLWAATHLRRGAVAVITAAAVTGNVVTLLLLAPPGEAVVDRVFFGAVLVVTAAMLDRSAATQDRLVAALHRQATVDSLTGLVNRRFFDEELGRVVESAAHPDGTALVLVDVDSFKQINDRYGHPVGDDALVHLAELIRGHVRSSDAVLSRLGGDELAILLPGCDAATAGERAGTLLAAVRAHPLALPDGSLLAVSVSIGVAHAAPSAGGSRGLYAAADAALYAAKRNGRDRFEVAPA